MTMPGGEPTVWPCPDGFALARTFGERLRQALAGRSGLAPIVVVAPTGRLLSRLQVLAAEAVGAAAGVRFLTYDRLARLVLEAAGEEAPDLCSRAAFEAVAAAAAVRSGGRLAEAVTAFEEGPRAVASVVRDLRESGATAESLEPQGLRDLARLLAEASRTLEGGRPDRAALHRRAAAAVAAPLHLFRVLHVGAYDVLPPTRALLASLGRAVPVEHLVLGLHEAPAFAWARARASLLGGARQAPVTAGLGGVLGPVLPHLFGAVAAGVPAGAVPGDAVELFGAPTSEAELAHAARAILAWHVRDGIPLERMAIVARRLDPYAAILAGVMAEHGLPFTSSADLPLWRQPAARSIVDGIGSRLADVAAAAAWSELVDAALAPEPAGTGDAPADVAEQARTAIRELQELDGLVPPPGPEGFAAAARRQVERARHPVGRRDRGGVRVLDAMQARGLTFRRAAVIGLHEDLFPRRGEPDPLLPDEARARLASEEGVDLPLKGDSDPEERLLFALLLGSVEERLLLGRQMADGRQRRRGVSPFVEELARLVPAMARAATILPTHPEGALASEAARGPVPVARALEAAGILGRGGPGAVGRLAEELGVLDDGLRAGLAHVEATSGGAADAPGALRFDGDLGMPVPRPPDLSVTALERLAQCPLAHFFRDVLGLRPLDDDADGKPWTDASVGQAVHAALQDVFAGLPWARGEGETCEAARSRLPAAVERALGTLVPPLAGGLRPAFREAVAEALASFVEEDVARLEVRGVASVATEEPFRATLDLPSGPLGVRGRFDRVVRHADGAEEVGDYKTGRYGGPLGVDGAIRDREIQLLLYAIARHATAGTMPDVALLRVRPGLPREDGGVARRTYHAPAIAAARGRLLGLLDTLVSLRDAGLFPMAPVDGKAFGPCTICDFRRACRTSHAQTRARVAAARPFAPFADLEPSRDPGGALR